MFLTFALVIILTLCMAKLFSASALWRYKMTKETLVYVLKFSLLYPIVLLKFIRRRSQNRRKLDLSNYTQYLLPQKKDWLRECPRSTLEKDEMDVVQFAGTDKSGNALFVSLTQKRRNTEVWLVVRYNDQIYTLPDHQKVWNRKYENERRIFIGNGLRLDVKEPCKKWRIWINTTVRKGAAASSGADESSLLHLKMHGWWTANTDLYDFNVDHDPSFFAKSLARSSWTRDLLQLGNRLNFGAASQWGHLIGEMKLGSGDDVVHSEISMGCMKSRLNVGLPWEAFTRFDMHSVVLENGTYLLLGSMDIGDTLKSFGYGFVCYPDGNFASVSDSDLIYSHSASEIIQFCSGGKESTLLITKSEAEVPMVIRNDVQIDGKAYLRMNKVKYDNRNGCGLHLHWSFDKCPRIDELFSTSEPVGNYATKYGYTSCDASLFILPLTHRAARCSDLTGGKGSRLAMLCEQQNEFIVPTGFCVTTAAYISHIEEHYDLKSLIEKLHCYGRMSDDELESTCSQIVQLLSETDLSRKLKSEIEFELRRNFHKAALDTKVAVRSSAVGEDSSDLSTAGQLETFLGRQGLESIHEAVRLCWASQFRLPSIQYRRQHGQSLTEPVAIVVQEMVEPDVSGVLFTADPVDCDPLKIVINAHPGLGEQIVSGSVTPDTIILNRSCFKREVTWENAVLGNELDDRRCCLSEAVAVKLGEIALTIEEAFDQKPQDIEWAVKTGRIYLLQARDITSLDIENQYDLMHEFDDAIRNDDDLYTTANAGEVMRNPQTPLSLSIQRTAMDMNIQAMMAYRGVINGVSPYYRLGVHATCCRVFLNMMDTFYREMCAMESTRVPEICLMGRPLNMPAVKKVALERYGKPPLYLSAYRLLRALQAVFIAAPKVLKSAARFANYHIPIDPGMDAKRVYLVLEKHVEDLAEGWRPHLLISMASSFAYNLVAAVLLPRDPHVELTTDHYSDIATLFSNCQDVISADVPRALKEISDEILAAGHSKRFYEMPVEHAIQWLGGSDSGEAGLKYRHFLEVHGHRSIDEIDIGAASWKTDPSPIVGTIQNTIRGEVACKKNKDIPLGAAISKLKGPTNFIQRLLLKKLVPFARRTVVEREQSKNLAIKVTDGLRNGYRVLGRMLAEMGYLPDEKLIFYLSHTEIGDLIDHRPAKLVAKAVRRRKLMKLLETFQYPEMNLQEDAVNGTVTSSTVVVRGTPVSEGIAEGPVRVARKLEDAKETRPGEILIATSTDIGWSPYFPMLAGVVTELGGLLSHGAVVAREYGLPCIVSAQNATSKFVTGDIARLDAGKGTLRKL